MSDNNKHLATDPAPMNVHEVAAELPNGWIFDGIRVRRDITGKNIGWYWRAHHRCGYPELDVAYAFTGEDLLRHVRELDSKILK